MYKYTVGQKVLFHDENQYEIRGLNVGMEDLKDRLIIKVKLDTGGIYYATLMKRT